MKTYIPKTLLLTAAFLVLNSFFWNCGYEDDYIPTNMLEAETGYFVEGRPVTVGQYAEFLDDVKRWWSPKFHKERLNQQQFNINRLDIYYKGLEIFKEEGLYEKMVPKGDFSFIDKEGKNREASYYLEREEYHMRPIINITMEMAKNYAMWKGDKMMIYYATQTNSKDERKEKYPRSTYFYPTPRASLEKVINQYELHQLDGSLAFPPEIDEDDLEEHAFAYKGLKELTSEGKVVSIGADGTVKEETGAKAGEATGFRCYCNVIDW